MQKAPVGLGTAGRKLWRDLVSPLAEDDLELTPRERQWLHQACKLQDRVTELEALMDTADAIVEGAKGQPVTHPLLNEIRQHHQLIGLLLARLDLAADDDQPTTTPFPIRALGL